MVSKTEWQYPLCQSAPRDQSTQLLLLLNTSLTTSPQHKALSLLLVLSSTTLDPTIFTREIHNLLLWTIPNTNRVACKDLFLWTIRKHMACKDHKCSRTSLQVIQYSYDLCRHIQQLKCPLKLNWFNFEWKVLQHKIPIFDKYSYSCVKLFGNNILQYFGEKMNFK